MKPFALKFQRKATAPRALKDLSTWTWSPEKDTAGNSKKIWASGNGYTCRNTLSYTSQWDCGDWK